MKIHVIVNFKFFILIVFGIASIHGKNTEELQRDDASPKVSELVKENVPEESSWSKPIPSIYTKLETAQLQVVSEANLKMLQEIEEYYKKILSSEITQRPNFEAIEQHKLILMNLIEEAVKLNTDDKLHSNIEGLLKIVTSFQTSLDNQPQNLDQVVSPAKPRKPSEPFNNIIHLNHNNNETQLSISQLSLNNSESASDDDRLPSNNYDIKISNKISKTDSNNSNDFASAEVKILSPILQKLNQTHPIFLGKPIFLQQQNKVNNNENKTTNSNSDINNITQFANRMGEMKFDHIPDETAAVINNLKKQSILQKIPNSVYGNHKNNAHPIFQQQPASYLPSSASPIRIRNPANDILAPQNDLTNLGGQLSTALISLLLRDKNALTGLRQNLLQSGVGQDNPQTNPLSQAVNYNQVLETFAKLSQQMRPRQPSNTVFVDTVIATNDPGEIESSFPSSSILDTTDEVNAVDLMNFFQTLNVSEATPNIGDILPNTRITAELATAFTTLITDLSAAFTDFLTNLSAAIAANPLLGLVLAIAALGLLYHLFNSKKHKGGYGHKPHGGGGGGYHRRKWDDRDEYRSLDSTVQVLHQIESFENWLKTVQNIYDKIS